MASDPDFADARAFVAMVGKLHDLNGLTDDSGKDWILSEAALINEEGWIVGYGQTGTHARAMFVAVPEGQVPPPSVPEPATTCLMVAGLLALGWGVRQRRHLPEGRR
jgi:hypothetical protein